MALQEFYDPTRGFLVNDTLVLEADVSVRKVVDYWAYDSKKETGFVGLKNQGATCYMNSLLQTLYHLAYFRKVLSLPPSLSLSLSLLTPQIPKCFTHWTLKSFQNPWLFLHFWLLYLGLK
jgi:hypothetical protein